jgi:hypothetical protein
MPGQDYAMFHNLANNNMKSDEFSYRGNPLTLRTFCVIWVILLLI